MTCAFAYSVEEGEDKCRSLIICRFIGGIVFKKFDVPNRRLSYAIRLREDRDSSRRWYTENEVWDSGGPFAILADHNPVPGSPNYWSSGFLSLQFAVDSLFLQVCLDILLIPFKRATECTRTLDQS